jgi:hypothetical protein
LAAAVESVSVTQSADALQPLYVATGVQVVAYDPAKVPLAAVPWYLKWLKKSQSAPSAASLCAALVQQNAGAELGDEQPAWHRASPDMASRILGDTCQPNCAFHALRQQQCTPPLRYASVALADTLLSSN